MGTTDRPDSTAEDAVDQSVSPAEGRLLCALLTDTLDGDAPASTGTLAERLGVAPATVTESLKELDRADLLSYEPYEGAELTDAGERTARTLLWRRCVVGRFFERTADVSLSLTQAHQIGQALSDAEVSRMSECLVESCDGRCQATTAAGCEWLPDRRETASTDPPDLAARRRATDTGDPCCDRSA